MPAPPYVLFLPGLACDSAVWRDQALALGRVTTVGVASYALSDSIEQMASTAMKFAPSQRFAVAGHSMGGRVAFEIIRQVPDKIAGLALLDTAYRGFPGGEAGDREIAKRAELVQIAQTKGMRAMAEFWMPGIIHPDRMSDTTLTGAILDMIARKTPEIFSAQIKALLGRPDATAQLAAIRCPTLVLCGRKDTWSPLAAHEEIVAAIPGSHLAVIEHSGHMAPMERPQEVTKAMREWFASL